MFDTHGCLPHRGKACVNAGASVECGRKKKENPVLGIGREEGLSKIFQKLEFRHEFWYLFCLTKSHLSKQGLSPSSFHWFLLRCGPVKPLTCAHAVLAAALHVSSRVMVHLSPGNVGAWLVRQLTVPWFPRGRLRMGAFQQGCAPWLPEIIMKGSCCDVVPKLKTLYALIAFLMKNPCCLVYGRTVVVESCLYIPAYQIKTFAGLCWSSPHIFTCWQIEKSHHAWFKK